MTVSPLDGNFPDPVAGDEVLVSTGCYGLPGEHWCRVLRVWPGAQVTHAHAGGSGTR